MIRLRDKVPGKERKLRLEMAEKTITGMPFHILEENR